MSITNQVLKEYYVVSSVNTKTNKREYEAIDSQSGGYPYWADDVRYCGKYDKPPVPNYKSLQYMSNDHPVIEVLLLQIVVADSWTADTAKENALLEKKRNLQQEILKLEEEIKKLK